MNFYHFKCLPAANVNMSIQAARVKKCQFLSTTVQFYGRYGAEGAPASFVPFEILS